MKRVLAVLVWFAVSAGCVAEGVKNASVIPEQPSVSSAAKDQFSNVGFMENPQEELTKKFPMCDKFLNVEWINKGKKIGYSEFDIYSHGECHYVNRFKSLVYLEPYRFTYNLIAYQINDKNNNVPDSYAAGLKNIPCHPYINERQRLIKDNFETVLKIMKESKPEDYPPPFGEKIGKVIELFPHHLDQGGYSLSGFTQNVCIVYPDGDRAWLAEIKNMGQTFGKEEIDKRFEEVGAEMYGDYYEINPSVPREAFEFTPVIDINNDGLKDYFINGRTLYFRDGGYRKLSYKKNEPLGCGERYSFVYGTQLTTDGRDFYYYDCNLTKLLSPEKTLNQK